MDKERFINILNRELVMALGCTEPVAIAYAAALAGKYVKGRMASHIKVFASGNVIKNAMAVSIPGTGGSGINLAAALGILAHNTDKNLELLTGLTNEDIENAKKIIKEGIVTVEIADSLKKLYIEVIVETPESYARVIIEDAHTNVVLIEVDRQIIENHQACCTVQLDENENTKFLTIDSIWEFINFVDVKELDIIKDSMDLNMKIALEGLKNPYGLQVGRIIKKNSGNNILSDDSSTYAVALTAAGSDARMAGCFMPVMSNSGSGNQGISATVPVVAFAESLKVEREKMIRAVTISHLITIYIKLKFGRLSALCGATISAIGASCGITYLLGGGIAEMKSAIQNMLGNVTGMLCDGAKPGCALKVATCTSAAIQSAVIALHGIAIQPTDGIIENDPEQTIENLCRLGNQGTLEADKIILEIMLKKANC
jgi:L-cysteine desulfidase